MDSKLYYDILIIATGVAGLVGAIWAGRKLNRAAREGRLIYIGKIRANEKKPGN